MIPNRTITGRVRRLSWRLAPTGPTRRQQQPDFEQDLWVYLIAAWPQFDRARGTEDAFVHAVLIRAARMIARTRRARKRCSVGPTEHEDAVVIGDAEPLDRSCDADRIRTENRLELEPAIARLPADLRALADLLETHSLSEAARALGVPRSSLQRTLARLRRHCDAAGVTP